jgi:hypothetical protein
VQDRIGNGSAPLRDREPNRSAPGDFAESRVHNLDADRMLEALADESPLSVAIDP